MLNTHNKMKKRIKGFDDLKERKGKKKEEEKEEDSDSEEGEESENDSIGKEKDSRESKGSGVKVLYRRYTKNKCKET